MSTRSPDPGQDPDELLPIVDEEDRPLRKATRAEVHKHDLMHRAAHVLVFNSDGEILLQLRAAGKDRHPGVWDSSAAGHVEAGEDYPAAAARELFEELGLKADIEELARISARDETEQEFVVVYRACADGPFDFNRAEIDKVEFVAVPRVFEELKSGKRSFAPSFSLVLDAAMKAIQTRESGE